MLLSKKTLFVHIMPCTKEMFINVPEKSRGRRKGGRGREERFYSSF